MTPIAFPLATPGKNRFLGPLPLPKPFRLPKMSARSRSSRPLAPPVAGPLSVGLIGCGNISNAYFRGVRPFAETVQIVACADLDPARAKTKADEHGIRMTGSVGELLGDPKIDIVLNLTVPGSHATVNLAALKAGKHAYCEKPFSLTYQEGLSVLAEARRRRLRVGCAPDTVLGGGIQTCRKVIDDGGIGRPVAAEVNMLCPGHESWHPSPEFYYLPGGGPLFDMGPYYLTALLTLLGPVRRVSAAARITFKERTITSQPLFGRKIRVRTPTHLAGALEFAQGSIATITMSFDVWNNREALLEVYGSEGSLSCPDPNTFGGDVSLSARPSRNWTKVALTHNDHVSRGIGLADMAEAIRNGRPHRMSAEMALHAVEVMEALHVSARTGRRVSIKQRFQRPAPLAPGLPLGRLDP